MKGCGFGKRLNFHGMNLTCFWRLCQMGFFKDVKLRVDVEKLVQAIFSKSNEK